MSNLVTRSTIVVLLTTIAAAVRAQTFLANPYCVSPVPRDRWVRVHTEGVAGVTQPVQVIVQIGSEKAALTVNGFNNQRFFMSNGTAACYEIQQLISGSWHRVQPTALGALNDQPGSRVRSNKANLVISWHDKIKSLGVTIKTRNVDGAGTDDAVYVDVGFKAWNVGGSDLKKFEKNSSDNFDLPLPSGTTFTLDDLIYVRLEKKGVGGFTGALDGPGGAWQPESVTIYTDLGALAVAPVPAGLALDHNTPAWLYTFGPLTPHRKLAMGLRVERDFSRITSLGSAIAFLTTEFKKAGVSGWQNGPIKGDPPVDAKVVGRLVASASSSNDGYTSMDLRVEKICTHGVCSDTNSGAGLPHDRYMRVEYKHAAPYAAPVEGARIQVTGRIQWDTDERGFYEIHPIGQSGENFGAIARLP